MPVPRLSEEEQLVKDIRKLAAEIVNDQGLPQETKPSQTARDRPLMFDAALNRRAPKQKTLLEKRIALDSLLISHSKMKGTKIAPDDPSHNLLMFNLLASLTNPETAKAIKPSIDPISHISTLSKDSTLILNLIDVCDKIMKVEEDTVRSRQVHVMNAFMTSSSPVDKDLNAFPLSEETHPIRNNFETIINFLSGLKKGDSLDEFNIEGIRKAITDTSKLLQNYNKDGLIPMLTEAQNSLTSLAAALPFPQPPQRPLQTTRKRSSIFSRRRGSIGG